MMFSAILCITSTQTEFRTFRHKLDNPARAGNPLKEKGGSSRCLLIFLHNKLPLTHGNIQQGKKRLIQIPCDTFISSFCITDFHEGITQQVCGNTLSRIVLLLMFEMLLRRMKAAGKIMLRALILNEHSTVSRMIDGEVKRKIATALVPNGVSRE